ncbi:hypothetical protein RRG08_021081 [Elysia crispata]|uniref:Uncharacterized protein n=1 Tax=Elysia crispata TaxID=231223 RepID=A0AAE0YE09_9GAST|nr:hypothetical protein RRG08_021081 [Elysia crispata]
MVGGSQLEEVSEFTYLGSIIDDKGGTGADIKTRIGRGGHEKGEISAGGKLQGMPRIGISGSLLFVAYTLRKGEKGIDDDDDRCGDRDDRSNR